MSPTHLREEGVRKAKQMAWQGTAKVLELAQRRSVQLSFLGTTSALLMLMRRNARHRTVRRPLVSDMDLAVNAAKAVGTGALWFMMRKRNARSKEMEHGKESASRPSISGMALAATVAKAFLSGSRQSEKKGTTRPGKNEAWRGLATAIGAALGTRRYRQKAAKA